MSFEVKLPLVYPVRQLFKDCAIADVGAAIRDAIGQSGLLDKMPAGAEVAITAGSRGIDRIVEIIKEAGARVREAGGKPFVVPAMGSHGGATVEGQVSLLAELGITEESVGMAIRASMETVVIGATADGTPIHVDRRSVYSGGILVINRVKPHTSMAGPHQSGILKMLVVGLGKRQGAEMFHRRGPAELKKLLPEIGHEILLRLPVIGAIGVVEDARDRVCAVRAVKPDEFLRADREMLEQAAALMPKLPFDELDVLVVDEMGKDISGTGMDANVIGRRCIRLEPDPPSPRITRIVALSLTNHSMGNAHGVAMADIVTERLTRQINWRTTRENALATHFPEKALLPLDYPSDREAVAAAIATCWANDPAAVRLARIRNTRNLEDIMVSESLLNEVKSNLNLTITGPARPLFD